jgi:CRP-like cAMP-binding protein
LLLSLSFFKSGAESEGFIEELCKAVTVRTNSPGDIIIKQGDLAKAMFFIVKGTLMVISDDGEINFGELGAGSYGDLITNNSWRNRNCV